MHAAVPARATLVGALLLFVAALAAYYPALGAGYVWDDDDYLLRNPVIPTARGLVALWIPGVTPQYYPAVFTSFWLEYRLWGFEPFGYHLVNVLLHATNATVVVGLARRLALPWPWALGALFAVHPVHVESVAWITERKNLLSGLGYLMAARAYLDADAARLAGAPTRRFRIATIGWFLLALLAKSVTCSLPAALVLLHLYRRERIDASRWVALAPLFALGLVLALHTAHVEATHVGASGADFDFSAAERTLIASRAVLFYAQKLLVPWPLMFVYPRWAIDAAAPSQWLAPVALLAAVAVGLVAWRRNCRGPLIAGAFFVGTLSPALGFVDFYPMLYSFVADHFQYLASLGVFAALVWAAHGLVGRRPRAHVLGVTVLLALGVLTWQRSHAYADEETLWRDTVARNPGAWMAHNNLACIEMDRGDHAAALVRLEDAIPLTTSASERSRLLRNLARACAGLGRHPDELRIYEQLQAEHGHHESYVARALESLGRDDEAARLYAQAVDDLQQRGARLLFARHLLRRGRASEAVPHLERHLELEAGVGRIDNEARDLLALARTRARGGLPQGTSRR